MRKSLCLVDGSGRKQLHKSVLSRQLLDSMIREVTRARSRQFAKLDALEAAQPELPEIQVLESTDDAAKPADGEVGFIGQCSVAELLRVTNIETVWGCEVWRRLRPTQHSVSPRSVIESRAKTWEECRKVLRCSGSCQGHLDFGPVKSKLGWKGIREDDLAIHTFRFRCTCAIHLIAIVNKNSMPSGKFYWK